MPNLNRISFALPVEDDNVGPFHVMVQRPPKNGEISHKGKAIAEAGA